MASSPSGNSGEPEQFGLFGEPERAPKTLGDLYKSGREARARRRAAAPGWTAARLPEPVPVPEPSLLEEPANEPADEPAPAPRPRRIWNVAELVGQVRGRVEELWPDLWVHGEISNLRRAPSGHLYFTLKDGDAQLPAVLFRRQAQMLRFAPEDGMETLLRGKVSVYEQRGQMQLIAETLEPVGAGALQIAFEQLKARLAAEGLFEAGRKKPLPPFPHCVGIVTSPSGAVIRDFLNVAGRRHAGLDVLLFPAAVQGERAVEELVAGLRYFNRERTVQIIVLARGGGSLEDLACFNDERLARAIAASELPVVSAVGHETDFTIADFVADLRAPTPSAAAELITAAQHRVEEQVAELRLRLGRAARYGLMLARQRFAQVPAPAALAARAVERLNRREQVLDGLRFRAEAATRHTLHFAASRLARCSVEAAAARVRSRLGERRGALEALRFRLEAASAITLQGACDRLRAATHALERCHPEQRVKLTRAAWATVDARLLRVSRELGRVAGTQWLEADARLLRAAPGVVAAPARRHAAAVRQLESLSPLAVLSRGYALVFDEAGRLVKRAGEVKPGEALRLRLAEGTLEAEVK